MYEAIALGVEKRDIRGVAIVARLHCRKCNKDYLLAFSCKGRWFCPSCHQKKVLLFGEFIKESVAYPLPHRQYVFSLPKMLRVYFRNNRELLKRLCQIANECLLEYLRQVTRQADAQLGMVTTIDIPPSGESVRGL